MTIPEGYETILFLGGGLDGQLKTIHQEAEEYWYPITNIDLRPCYTEYYTPDEIHRYKRRTYGLYNNRVGQGVTKDCMVLDSLHNYEADELLTTYCLRLWLESKDD